MAVDNPSSLTVAEEEGEGEDPPHRSSVSSVPSRFGLRSRIKIVVAKIAAHPTGQRKMGYARAIAQPTRAHSITVFGCTGNAGKAVAYHVIRNAAQQTSTSKIALAGRNKERITNILSSIQNELSAEGIDSSFIIQNVNIIIADVTNYTSMLELCQTTNVLISATGPYSRYGEPVVRACIECKTHYVDITGEVPWVERMIGKRQCV